jgi:hypothetical protein
MASMFIGDDKTHFSRRSEAACRSKALIPIYESKRVTPQGRVTFILSPRIISPTLNATSVGPPLSAVGDGTLNTLCGSFK